MSNKILPTRGFKSKTEVTSCGYCNLKIKEENLENHCRTVHKKPKLVAGQRTLQGMMFSRSSTQQELSNNNVGVFPPVVEPDPTPPPPSKKLKYSEDCDDLEEEGSEVIGRTDKDDDKMLKRIYIVYLGQPIVKSHQYF